MVKVLSGGPVTITPSAWDVTEAGELLGRISTKDGFWFAWSMAGMTWTECDSRTAALEFVQAEARASQPTLVGA